MFFSPLGYISRVHKTTKVRKKKLASAHLIVLAIPFSSFFFFRLFFFLPPPPPPLFSFFPFFFHGEDTSKMKRRESLREIFHKGKLFSSFLFYVIIVESDILIMDLFKIVFILPFPLQFLNDC